MSKAEEVLTRRVNTNPETEILFFQKVAPIVQSMMDDLVEQLDTRFDQFGSSYGELYINLFAINKVLIDKGIVLPEEMQQAVQECSTEFMKLMEAESKKERAENATTIKV